MITKSLLCAFPLLLAGSPGTAHAKNETKPQPETATPSQPSPNLASQLAAARSVIERAIPEIKARPSSLRFTPVPKVDGKDVFETSCQNGVLTVKASSGVAACRGFYDFLKSNALGMVGWANNRVSWPAKLPDQASKRVVSPVTHHYYLNVVTYGYTTPYWDWNRWEREIDWMALHGIDMPLALVATEAIGSRVWKSLGLTQQEIDRFFVGPAHLPWLRMGNITRHDGGLSDAWHSGQIALQHKILKRMRELGMKPVCPAFAGFVPADLKRLHPDVHLMRLGWGGWPADYAAHMLHPSSDLFSKIGALHVKEWEKEFGKNDYYLADSFNEMELPGNPEEKTKLLQTVGERIYSTIHSASPGATWVMQGWMLGYQRNIWNAKSLADLVSRVPDDKMLILDLAADYNKTFWHNSMNWDVFQGFCGKPWVYSVVPNMGGKSGMTGVLDFYANGHLEALESPNRGKLAGLGLAPEGTENNELLYELVTDAGWNANRTDLDQWLANYFKARYGSCPPQLLQAMQSLRETCYANLKDHPRFNWQSAPGTRHNTMEASDKFLQGLAAFVNTPGLENSPMFQQDAIEMTAQFLGVRMSRAASAMLSALDGQDSSRALQAFDLFARYGKLADSLLLAHPDWRLERWIEFARKQGSTPAESDRYESNARRLVTVWGPPIDDYSARLWSGLIRDYYLPRWKHYLDSRLANKPANMRDWEINWVKSTGLSQASRPDNVIALCRKAVNEDDSALASLGQATQGQVIGNWTPGELNGDSQTLTWKFPAAELGKLKGVRFTYTSGRHALDIQDVQLVGDGKVISSVTRQSRVGINPPSAIYQLDIPADAKANNDCEIRATVKPVGGTDSNGKVEWLAR